MMKLKDLKGLTKLDTLTGGDYNFFKYKWGYLNISGSMQEQPLPYYLVSEVEDCLVQLLSSDIEDAVKVHEYFTLDNGIYELTERLNPTSEISSVNKYRREGILLNMHYDVPTFTAAGCCSEYRYVVEKFFSVDLVEDYTYSLRKI